ncbi:hypothetical protein PO124_30820 [Bacillus licheniformis]|nr:hypothetical protein [Bacillus licheniformis]
MKGIISNLPIRPQSCPRQFGYHRRNCDIGLIEYKEDIRVAETAKSERKEIIAEG